MLHSKVFEIVYKKYISDTAKIKRKNKTKPFIDQLTGHV